MSSRGNFPLTLKLQVQGDAEVNNKLKQVAASLNQISPAATKASTSTKQVETSLKSTGTAANSSSSGLKTYGGALTSLGSATTQARTGTEGFTGALNSFSAANTTAKGGLDQTNTVIKGLVPEMGKAGAETTKTGGAMQKLTDFMQGNKGLIFSVTMLGSGISEAIGMYQGWQDASEKLNAAKEREADLLARGLEGTKEYGDAVNDVADAQRGYNFITRFTIQSFGDLVPMTLMLTSSLLDMTSKMGGMSAAKAKLAAAGSKLVSVFSALGSTLMNFTTRHPLLAMLTLASAAVLALIKNFMGFRDAVNQLGVSLGQVLSPLKPILEQFGLIGNQALDTADSILSFGVTSAQATEDYEKQVLKTGDATKLSYQEQIEFVNKFGEEAGDVTVSLGAYLKQQQQDTDEHKTKYAQFVEAMQSGNQEIAQSLGLTQEEFKTFSEEFQQSVEAMDETWNTGVESILGNWDAVKSGFGESVSSTVGEIQKLEAKITELTAQQWDLDDKKALQKNRDEIAENQAKIDELRGTTTSSLMDMGAAYDIFGNAVVQNMGQKITPEMEAGGRAFIQLGEQAKQGLDSVRLGILSGDFEGAINGLRTAIDGVPPQYQKNFTMVNSIINNGQLEAREKVAQIVSTFGSLENAFSPMIEGAYKLNYANAEVASSLDELSVAARSNMTDMSQAEGAWNKFLASLKPAQAQLPQIVDLQARLKAGTIDYAGALQEAEAVGRQWSTSLGKDVATSIKNVTKTMVDMGDGTTSMVAEVNGQMVNLGRVSNTELGNVSSSLQSVDSSMSNTAQTANTEIANEATSAIGVFGKDGKFHFGTVVDGANTVIDIFKAVSTYADSYITKGAGGKITALGDTMKTTSKTTTTETGKWGKDIETFKTNAVKWLGEVQTTLDTLWKSAQERLNNTNFQNLLPNAPEVGAVPGGAGASFVPYVDTATADAALDKFLQHVQQVTSQASAAFSTMWTSISGSLTRISGLFPTAFTTLYTYATQATGQTIGVFTKMQTTVTGILSQLGAAVGSNFVTPALTALGGLVSVVDAVNTQFSAFATAIAQSSSNAGNAILTNFVTPASNGFKIFIQVFTSTSTGYQAFASAITKSSQTAAGGVVNSFITPASNAFKIFIQVYTSTAQGYQAFASSIAKSSTSASGSVLAMQKSMSTNLSAAQSKANSFASAVQSAFNKVGSAATSNANKVKQLKASIDALKSKTITITVKYNVQKPSGLEHGGAFMTHAQHGFSGIINQPTKFGGVRMGEGFKPELVTVTPLTRGTGNTNGLTRAAGGSSTGGGSGGGVANITIPVILDGREIGRASKKFALDDFGYQI